MEQVRERVAGLDVHRDSVVACARVPGARGKPAADRQRFGTTSAQLRVLAEWLAERGVTTVAMEATGVYWKPVFYALEGLFDEVWLCNAHHVKNVPGRKTDMADAEWLADVVAHGMVRPSFVPPPAVRELRELTRYRKAQIDTRGREIQRLEKLLQDAGIKISSVASRVLSGSSRAMLEAMIGGERDPGVLASLAKGKMRPKIPALSEALDGHFGSHHAAASRALLDHIDFLDDTIVRLTDDITARLEPIKAAVELLCTIPGVSERTAEVIVSEAGVDMSRFPTPGHLAAWAGVAPASHESAGKRRPAGTRQGARWLRRTLIEAAHAAARTRGTYLGAQYRQIAARRGENRAAVAVAHSIVVSAWHMLSTGQRYEDLGADYFRDRRDPALEVRRLLRRLEALGQRVTVQPVA